MGGLKTLLREQAQKEKARLDNMSKAENSEEEEKKGDNKKTSNSTAPKKTKSKEEPVKKVKAEKKPVEKKTEKKNEAGHEEAKKEEKPPKSKGNGENNSIESLVAKANKVAENAEQYCNKTKIEVEENGKKSPEARKLASMAREQVREISKIMLVFSMLESPTQDSTELKIVKADLIVAEDRVKTAARRATGFLGGASKVPEEEKRHQRNFTISDAVYFDALDFAQDGERNGTGAKVSFSRLIESALKEYVENHSK